MIAPETIVALSSTVGQSARIVLRLSGPRSHQIAASLVIDDGFFAQPNAVTRSRLSVRGLVFPAYVYTFIAPRSYTGEDGVELHLPGNPLLARLTMEACVGAGARLAEPGEFTARAYFNGKLDLTEAEGVAATIAAHNDADLAAARQLTAGELSRRLKPTMDLLADTLALVEVGIDFVDEDVTFLSREQIAQRLAQLDQSLADLQAGSSRFEALSHEPRVVLAGRPNAGKSTLLNALARQDRAVVSPIAGTTRDALSARVLLRRGSVQLVDVAGLEPATDSIGRQMQARAAQEIARADVLLLLQDSADSSPALQLPREPDLHVLTKADLHPPGNAGDACVTALPGEAAPIGLDALRHRLDQLAFGVQTPGASLALTARHLQAIADARAALARAADQQALETLAADLRDALDALGRILGVVAPDDLLGRIFSAFCIGK